MVGWTGASSAWGALPDRVAAVAQADDAHHTLRLRRAIGIGSFSRLAPMRVTASSHGPVDRVPALL